MSRQQDALGRYLANAAKVPLLTHEEEIALSRQVQDWVTHPNYPDDIEEPVPPAIVAAGIAAKRRFMAANIRLVISVAKKYQDRGLSFEDLIQEGTLGLERAVMAFDATKGFRFSTYAYWWIRQGITRGLQDHSKTIRIPAHVWESLTKAKRAASKYYEAHGRYPSHRALGEAMIADGKLKPPSKPPAGQDANEIALAKLEGYMLMALPMRSLNYIVNEGEGSEMGELGSIIPCPLPQPTEAVAEDSRRELVHELVNTLSPQQRRVIRAAFGLDGLPPRTLSQIAAEMGLPKEAARGQVRTWYRSGLSAMQRQLQNSDAIELARA